MTRGGFLRATGTVAVGAWAVGLAGCAQPPPAPPVAGELPASRREVSESVAILAGLLAHAHRQVAAYTAATPLLAGGPLEAAARFLGQELGHAAELGDLVKAGGGRPARFDPGAYDLGRPRTAGDILALLRAAEEASIAAHLDAITRLAPGPLRATLGSILADEAQQLAVLRRSLGLPELSGAFVTGLRR